MLYPPHQKQSPSWLPSSDGKSRTQRTPVEEQTDQCSKLGNIFLQFISFAEQRSGQRCPSVLVVKLEAAMWVANVEMGWKEHAGSEGEPWGLTAFRGLAVLLMPEADTPRTLSLLRA